MSYRSSLALGAVLLVAFPGRADVVEVNLSAADGHAIGHSFIGLSYEKSSLFWPLFQPENSGLVALFQRLGPGILRVGGNSVDLTQWDSTGAGLVGKVVSPPDLERLAGFLRATHWKVIYGVNLASSSPDLAASEANAADSILGDRLEAFEIGNEVDLYSKDGHRPADWTFEQFRAQWDSFQLAMSHRAPGVPFTGPATATTGAWLTDFAHEEGGKISLLTFHYYLANGQLATSTVAKLLEPNPLLVAVLQKYDSIARDAGIPGGYRVAETNSYYNGGAPGVSASFGAGLWALNYLFTLATCGASGVNFHGGGSSPGYTPIANNFTTGEVIQVRPLYYALSLFSLVSHGVVRKAVLSDSSVLHAWTVDDSDGTRHIVLLNEDTLQSIPVVLHPGPGFLETVSYTLAGNRLQSYTGVTLGGAPIGTDGSWSPFPTLWKLDGDSLKTTVTPATAQIFTFSKTIAIRAPLRGLPPEAAGPAYDLRGRPFSGSDPGNLRLEIRHGSKSLSSAP